MLRSWVFFSQLKIDLVKPSEKTNHKNEVQKYQPVSLIFRMANFVGKIMMKCINMKFKNK